VNQFLNLSELSGEKKRLGGQKAYSSVFLAGCITSYIPVPEFFAMQVAHAVIPSGFAETAWGIWVNAERSPDGPSGLGLTGVHGQKIADSGYITAKSKALCPIFFWACSGHPGYPANLLGTRRYDS
jgi:hypothetical protein